MIKSTILFTINDDNFGGSTRVDQDHAEAVRRIETAKLNDDAMVTFTKRSRPLSLRADLILGVK